LRAGEGGSEGDGLAAVGGDHGLYLLDDPVGMVFRQPVAEGDVAGGDGGDDGFVFGDVGVGVLRGEGGVVVEAQDAAAFVQQADEERGV